MLSTQEHSDGSRLSELLGALVSYAEDIACHFILDRWIFSRHSVNFQYSLPSFSSFFFFLSSLLTSPLLASPWFLPRFYCTKYPLFLICLGLLFGSNSHVLLCSDVLPLMFLLSSNFTGCIQSPTQIPKFSGFSLFVWQGGWREPCLLWFCSCKTSFGFGTLGSTKDKISSINKIWFYLFLLHLDSPTREEICHSLRPHLFVERKKPLWKGFHWAGFDS